MHKQITILCSTLALLTSVGVLQSCKDNDYSFDNIDATIGLGADEIALPGGNDTKEIPLDDVVHLNNSNFVYIDDNGDYQIKVTGNSQETSTVSIAPFTIKASSSTSNTVPVTQGTFQGQLAALNMSATTPTEVEELSSVACDQDIVVTLKVPNTVRRIDELTLSLPTFLQIDRATNDGSNGQSITKVKTDMRVIEIHIHTLVREKVRYIVELYRSEAVKCEYRMETTGSACDGQVGCGASADVGLGWAA